MVWFKNLMIYRLTKALDWTEDSLQTALQQCEYHPCQQSDMSKFGWTNPLRGSEMLHFRWENRFYYWHIKKKDLACTRRKSRIRATY